MKSGILIALLLFVLVTESCDKKANENIGITIGSGQMPDLTVDSNNNFQVVYGLSDSIMYSSSIDHGETFTIPGLIAVLPGLAASHMRGPQIATAINGVTVIAIDSSGDIFCYRKERNNTWSGAVKINDVDAVAKEAFMDLAADGPNLFAVWLDLRHQHNEIYGAGSSDGGKTWTENKLIYASPDTTVCECCKPSVAIKGGKVYVMFRNWLKGNRDMYLIESADGGLGFGEAQKLGNDHWALNGCPMDGGGLTLNNTGNPETVWFRKNTIYTCQPGQPEMAIGKGRNCTIESVGGKNVYAWTENGQVIIISSDHEKRTIGKGTLPVIKSINSEQILCIWENENKIQSTVIKL